jgi:hypothetical protein
LVRARSCLFHSHMWHADSVSAQATGAAVPSVAASMIVSLREKPSREDELTSKAVPATMYIGKFLSFFSL